MLVLGIDPGTAVTGYGLVRGGKGARLVPVDFGCIRTEANWPLTRRLQAIYRGILQVIQQFKPDAVAVEELFFSKNVQTTTAVGYSRGIALLAATEAGCPVFEYPPAVVKRAVTGQGRAAKEQVQYMVQQLLRLKAPPVPDDVADALAVAICHLHTALTAQALTSKD
ncbi:MAG: crossover junction endodeoxyribonuclease RuvC [Bacillota bacterium]